MLEDMAYLIVGLAADNAFGFEDLARPGAGTPA